MRGLVAIAATIGACQPAPPSTDAREISLVGVHRFAPGDDPRWADPAFDDASWREIRVPASWQSQGIDPPDGVGWYRIRFRLDRGLDRSSLGVALGVIGDVDEAFLGGVRIGGEGAFGNGLVEPPPIHRVYRLPEALLGDENVLAVRVQNTYSRGGIVSPRIAISDHRSLLLEKHVDDLPVTVKYAVLFTVCGLGLLVGALLYLRAAGRGSLDLALFFLSFSLLYAFESPTLYAWGLKSHAVQRLSYANMCVLPGVAVVAMTRFLGGSLSRWTVPALALSAGLAVVSLGGPTVWSKLPFVELHVVLLLASASLTVAQAIGARRRGVPEARTFLWGLAGLGVTVLLEAISSLRLDFVAWMLPFTPIDVGIVVFVTSLVSASVSRFLRARRQIETLSQRLIQAHDVERRRLARDLHDGPLQALASIKLRVDGETSQALSNAIDELRGVTHDLHTATVGTEDLGEALRAWAARFPSPPEIRVEAPASTGAPDPIKLHFYRVFQEALGNARKHAAANRIDVRLACDDGRLRLTVRDDGRGFRLQADARRGLGLSTMAERAALIGGWCRVDSAPGRGTTVELEAPLEAGARP